ncbi:MarR family winged helix-turn-helix transcriptional regulator [Streptomyces sp. NPDC056437]|uniref:MarR family winged helix-turn-helix transcriptional regulator n=1 Tax=Streptomyces sp. NPDC056437 TaxID=3345816 RepID=UPI0036A9ED33
MQEVAAQVAEAAEALASIWVSTSRSASPRLSALQTQALLIARRLPGINLTGLADEIGAAPPNVSRLCDRLEAAGLLRRQAARNSRREIGLVLTPQGHELINTLLTRRQAAFGEVLSRMPTKQRTELVTGLQAFAEAAHCESDRF